MWPVFVFGTGRCGSTHIQRLITLSTCCWIWGEHGGFLEPLLASVSRYENSQGLEKFVFGRVARNKDQLIADMTAGSEMLSWVNELDRYGYRTGVKSLVDRMFQSRLPEGWTEWGFKEIRYGLNNEAPSMLLNLFDDATAAFTFRDPKSTIESMIRTWSPDLLNGAPAVEDLSRTYRICATRYNTIVKYFLDFRAKVNRPIIFISSDKLERSVEEILQTLGLPCERAIPNGLSVTNPGPSSMPEWAKVKSDELFAKDEAEFLDLFTRACAQSDADCGRFSRDQLVSA
jgi:hypothetical protein